MFSDFKEYNKEVRRYMLKNVSRYFLRWKKSLRPGASSVKDEQPWITFNVIDFLNKNIKPTDKVFEFGGGGSTLFFVKRASEVVTVEHNKEWFNILSETLKNKKVNNWKGVFVPATKGDIVPNPEAANPEHYSSEDLPSKGFNYKEYVTVIDSYPNEYFDCVVVDGRSRPACIVHSLPKLKKGGFLVLDNSDREYYLQKTDAFINNNFEVIIDTFGPSPYSKDFTKTSVWKKK